MEHTHLLSPHENFQLHSIHICRENECQPKFTQRGVTSAVCSGVGSTMYYGEHYVLWGALRTLGSAIHYGVHVSAVPDLGPGEGII